MESQTLKSQTTKVIPIDFYDAVSITTEADSNLSKTHILFKMSSKDKWYPILT